MIKFTTFITTRKVNNDMSKLKYELTKTPFDVLNLVKMGKVLLVDFQDDVLFNPLEAMGNIVFGVTSNTELADKMYQGGFDNVFVFDTVNMDMLFHENEFDTIIVDGGLHEMFTRYRNGNASEKIEFNRKAGAKSMVTFFVKAYDMLKDGGKLIIRDYSLPDVEYENDNIMIGRDENFENYLQKYLESEMNQGLWINNEYKRTVDENLDIIFFKINELINVFASIIEGKPNSQDKEFAFLSFRGIIKYLELSGFEQIEFDTFSDERMIILAQHLKYKNYSRDENLLPDTNMLLVATK